jgi:hypothetical protein
MISAIPNTSLPSPYLIPSPVISLVAIAVIEVLVYISIYEPFSSLISLYAFDFRFSFFLHTISAVSILLYPSLYSIPSPVISVVIRLGYTSIYDSLFRFSNLPLFPPVR